MATRKKKADAEETAEAKIAPESEATADTAPEAEVKEEKKASSGAGFTKGQTYAARGIMPIYDKIGGEIIGSVYKNDPIVTKGSVRRDGRTYIVIENGYVVGEDENGNVYFA